MFYQPNMQIIHLFYSFLKEKPKQVIIEKFEEFYILHSCKYIIFDLKSKCLNLIPQKNYLTNYEYLIQLSIMNVIFFLINIIFWKNKNSSQIFIYKTLFGLLEVFLDLGLLNLFGQTNQFKCHFLDLTYFFCKGLFHKKKCIF